MIRRLCRLLGVAGLVLVSDPALCQIEPEGTPASGPWRFSTEFDAETRYDSNVFLLDPARKDVLASPSSADLASGRYADMENAGDLVTTLRWDGRVRGRGLFARSLTLTPAVEYDFYARNSKRSNAHFALTLRQALPKGGQVGLRGRVRPHYFSKNYLADAVDVDGSGTISKDERVYRPGEYADGDLSLELRTRLAKSTRERPVEALLEIGAGYYRRDYDAPFPGRDLDGPTASAVLSIRMRRGVEFDLGYEVAALSASATPEVLILDEPDFDVDFNGDGLPDDSNARTVQFVDRSHVEHAIGLDAGFDAGAAARVRLSYEYLLRNYSSEEPFDVGYRDRHDTRHTFGIGLDRRVGHGLRLGFGGEYASQSTNRGGDPGWSGDTEDFSRIRASFMLMYEL